MAMKDKIRTRDGFEVHGGHDGKMYYIQICDDDALYLNEKDFEKLCDLLGRISPNGGVN